jgi:rhamnosyltransferase
VTEKVAVLLATFNGQSYIVEQLESIATQIGVSSHIYLSDDGSSDNTVSSALRAASRLLQVIELVSCGRHELLSLHSSATNFYHLIANVEPSPDTHWIAFSDQDDVWNSDHLIRAITVLRGSAAVGYSSNVIAFWPDGTQRLVKKVGSITPLNHLFESPGPGCSMVLSRSIYDELQGHLRSNLAKIARIEFHDWAIYAFVRSRKGKWIIDAQSSLLYRQHGSNVLGVQLGFRNLSRRLRMLAGGWYRAQVLAIADYCGQLDNRVISRLVRLSLRDRVILSFRAFALRRQIRDKVLLAVAFMCMTKPLNFGDPLTRKAIVLMTKVP